MIERQYKDHIQQKERLENARRKSILYNANKIKEHKNMVDNLRRGDQVLTQGGIIGKITKVKEGEEIEVELAKDVKVSVIRSTIVNVLSKTEPAKK